MKKTLLVTSLALCLTACDSGEDKTTLKPTTPNVATELATELDEKFLLQIKKTMDVVDTDKLWQGYDYKSTPQYFIRRENNNPVTAFVINPQTDIIDGQTLGNNESQGLHVVKYEESMLTANDKLNSGNGIYDYDFKIDGKGYYIQAYTKDEIEITNPIITSTFSLAVHEVFHAYQNSNFKNPESYEQLPFDKFDTYPLNKELLSLQLMFMNIVKDYPIDDISQEDAKSALKRYVVIVNEMLKIDPTAHSGYQAGLIYKHGLGQELFEGSALYIDVLASRKVMSITSDKKFIFQHPFNMDKASNRWIRLKTKKDVEDYFAFQVFYYTGASAIWLLNQAGYHIKNLEMGIYPFDAAKGFLKMSEIEEMNLLSELKQESSWSQAQAAALRYSTLK